MKGKLIIVTTVLVAAGFFWSCSIFGPGETTTGTVSLSLTGCADKCSERDSR